MRQDVKEHWSREMEEYLARNAGGMRRNLKADKTRGGYSISFHNSFISAVFVSSSIKNRFKS